MSEPNLNGLLVTGGCGQVARAVSAEITERHSAIGVHGDICNTRELETTDLAGKIPGFGGMLGVIVWQSFHVSDSDRVFSVPDFAYMNPGRSVYFVAESSHFPGSAIVIPHVDYRHDKLPGPKMLGQYLEGAGLTVEREFQEQAA